MREREINQNIKVVERRRNAKEKRSNTTYQRGRHTKEKREKEIRGKREETI